MITGRLGQLVSDNFTVVDINDNPVSGLLLGDFIVNLYNPSGVEVSGTIPISITSLGSGDYKITFTPNVVGNWYIKVRHSNHFPWGKGESIQIFINDVDTLGEMLLRVLGLVQENQMTECITYNSQGMMTVGKITTYSDAISVGTPNNILAVYDIEANYFPDGIKLKEYKVKKQ